METPEARIPALVVSGFLGSGKTTLVRRILAGAQATGERVAVLSNEFGALGIDRALLGAGERRYVELDGGCVCCELSDELVDALEALRRDVAPDRIVIETSGVALPYETQLSLWRPPVSAWIGDDMAVVVVNAEQLAEGRDLDGSFVVQVTSADLLLLNQVDRVEPGRVPGLVERLREIEPEAPVVTCVQGEVDPALLRPPELDAARRARRTAVPPPHRHDAFRQRVLELEPGLAPGAVVERVRAEGAVRAKGFVETAEGVRLVQGVGRRVELSARPCPDPALVGRVVVISRAEQD